ncbi:MAG: alpha/beta hydrolase [Acidimicrobiales bacterium]
MANDALEQLKAILQAQPLFLPDIEASRMAMARAAEAVPVPDEAVVEPMDAGGVRAERVSMPTARDDVWLLYNHGGGYISGSAATYRRLCCLLSAATNATVCSLNYRLAPEYPFPAGPDDVVTAWRWLIGPDGPTGASAARTAIAGDSAGGGLVVAALAKLRDARSPLPSAAFVISPWVDLTLTSGTIESRAADDVVLSREILDMCSAAYRNGSDASDPTVSPAFADLTGLPPLLIHVGDAEILLDDARQLEA